MSWLTIENKVFKRGVEEYSKLFSQSHSLWCGNILFIKDACLDIHRKKHVSCSQRHLSPEGGSPNKRSTLRFKACVMTFGELFKHAWQVSAEGVKCYISTFYFAFLFSCQLKSASSFYLFLLLLLLFQPVKYIFLLLSMNAIPQSYIGDASNAIPSIRPIIFMSVLKLCVNTTVRRKFAFYLFSIWQLLPFLSLKHLDLPSSCVFFSYSDTQM